MVELRRATRRKVNLRAYPAAVVVAAAIAGCTGDVRGAAAYGTGGASASRAEDVVAIANVTVVDVAAVDAARAARADHTVLIADGRITEVGPTGSVTVPRAARLIDARGGYVVPGLWESHAHVTRAGEPGLTAYVANGVTTVRDLGGRMSQLVAWRREIRGGTRVGPRLLLAGPNIEGAWWLDAVVGFLSSDPVLRSFPFLATGPRYRLAAPGDAPAIIDSLARLGVDLIKFRNLRPDEFRAVAAEARRRGIPLVGHAPIRVSPGDAAEAGLLSFEHVETVTLQLGDAPDSMRRAELARVARAGTAITPTLVTDVAFRQTPDSVAYGVIADTANRRDPRRRYATREFLASWRFGLDAKRFERPSTPASWAESHRRQVADTRRAREAGVPLLVGTDLGVSLVYPGFSVHDELRLLVDEAGLTPLEALRAATLAPARTMRMADSLGLVAAGKVADLVLLEADPLRDIRNTTRIRAVIVGGRVLERPELDRLLEEAARAARKTF